MSGKLKKTEGGHKAGASNANRWSVRAEVKKLANINRRAEDRRVANFNDKEE